MLNDKIKEKTYYEHKRTGQRILVVDSFPHSCDATNWEWISMCHCVICGKGTWRYIKADTI